MKTFTALLTTFALSALISAAVANDGAKGKSNYDESVSKNPITGSTTYKVEAHDEEKVGEHKVVRNYTQKQKYDKKGKLIGGESELKEKVEKAD